MPARYTLSRAYGELGQDALAKYAVAEQAYAVGDLQRARSFAWRRASDIIVVSDAQLAKKNRGRRGPKPLTFNVSGGPRG